MIAIITDAGTLEMELDQGKCVGCRRVGGGMVAATLDEVGGDPVEFIVCGNCIRGGLYTVINKAREDA